ncbi:unnamed protein product [Meganyctiphanes norvegica]|uniref:Wilms tumor protein homolog n=1 Tax=Meganyctiphanes norvegica TaxID=48144 RepID=A0AAV2RQS6_MEGNR
MLINEETGNICCSRWKFDECSLLNPRKRLRLDHFEEQEIQNIGEKTRNKYNIVAKENSSHISKQNDCPLKNGNEEACITENNNETSYMSNMLKNPSTMENSSMLKENLNSQNGLVIESNNNEVKDTNDAMLNENLTENSCKVEYSKAADEECKIGYNPLMTELVHPNMICCINGHFQVCGGPFSEFESNSKSTSRSLVDWSTRVTWSNLALRHSCEVNQLITSNQLEKNVKLELPKLNNIPARNIVQFVPAFPIEKISNEMTPNSLSEILHGDNKSRLNDQEDEERPFLCTSKGCSRAFARNEELTRHLRIHSGQRPFLCPTCSRRFVRRDHLSKHIRTHLPADAKRTYTCPIPDCQHRYTRSDALTRHMWTAHQIKARQPPQNRKIVVVHHQRTSTTDYNNRISTPDYEKNTSFTPIDQTHINSQFKEQNKHIKITEDIFLKHHHRMRLASYDHHEKSHIYNKVIRQPQKRDIREGDVNKIPSFLLC